MIFLRRIKVKFFLGAILVPLKDSDANFHLKFITRSRDRI